MVSTLSDICRFCFYWQVILTRHKDKAKLLLKMHCPFCPFLNWVQLEREPCLWKNLFLKNNLQSIEEFLWAYLVCLADWKQSGGCRAKQLGYCKSEICKTELENIPYYQCLNAVYFFVYEFFSLQALFPVQHSSANGYSKGEEAGLVYYTKYK